MLYGAAERLPIAKSVLAATDAATRLLATVVALENPMAVALRDAVLGLASGQKLFRTKLTRRISMLDITYPSSPIVAQDRTALWATPPLLETEPSVIRDGLRRRRDHVGSASRSR